MDTEKKQKRIIATVVCVLFLALILLSTAYIIQEADHECIGENCPICACIHIAEQTLKQLGTGAAALSVVAPMIFIGMATLISVLPILPCETPVSKKIRMNN